MITDNSVRAGTVLECAKHRFGAVPNDDGQTTLAVVLSPAPRQRNRIFNAVPLTDSLPNNRDVLYVELQHGDLKALSSTGQWFALCDRMSRVSLDSDDVQYLRRERGSAVNFQPRYRLGGNDLKSIRFAMVQQLFPDSDIRVYFRSGLKSFRALTKRLMLRMRPTKPFPPTDQE